MASDSCEPITGDIATRSDVIFVSYDCWNVTAIPFTLTPRCDCFIGITDYTVWERITVSWSSGSHLTWNHAFKSLKYIHSEDNTYKALDDIAILTKKRANAEYGLLVSELEREKTHS